MLNLTNALRLAELIDPYIPVEIDYDAPIFDFAGTILENIVLSEKHADYLALVSLMSKETTDDLLQMSKPEVFRVFVDGLEENNILALIEFYRGIKAKLWQTRKS